MMMIATRYSLLIIFSCSTLVLSGCHREQSPLSTEGKQLTVKTQLIQSQRETERLAQCQNELEILQELNPTQYKAYRKVFDSMMSGAAQYAHLRSLVSNVTQETVDALYRYRVNRLCSELSQSTLIGLAERAEQLR